MSTSSSLSTVIIKLEHNSDDELIAKPSTNDYSPVTPPFQSTYKGKIEVTSKGRRKIFDGVRWQILCRRPGEKRRRRRNVSMFLFKDCRKQTNKKSLCITHYKEEYESAIPSLRTNSFHLFTLNSDEDQNNTITTSNMIDTDEQYSINIKEDQIKSMHNGRRYILKNRKWQPLCKYDHICRNMAKYNLLCVKHFQMRQEKRRQSTMEMNQTKRIRPGLFNTKTTNFQVEFNHLDLPISSPTSIIDQFNINSDEKQSIVKRNDLLQR